MDYDISGKYIILFFIKEKVNRYSKGKEKNNWFFYRLLHFP